MNFNKMYNFLLFVNVGNFNGHLYPLPCEKEQVIYGLMGPYDGQF